jgi:nucleotide-binding universal stress UspA family protein
VPEVKGFGIHFALLSIKHRWLDMRQRHTETANPLEKALLIVKECPYAQAQRDHHHQPAKENTLLRFVPSEALEAAPALTDVWQSRAGKQIAPVMQHAQQMLVQAGVAKSRIAVKIVEGSRSAGADILKAANEHACGTIVVGRHGETGHKTFPMGSVARTVVQKCEDMAVWIVP